MSCERRCTCEACPQPWRDPSCPFHGDGAEPILSSVAQGRAERRMLEAEGKIRVTLDGLELGWDLDQVLAYLKGSASFHALGEARGQVLGMVAAFAIVAVERDRELRSARPTAAQRPGPLTPDELAERCRAEGMSQDGINELLAHLLTTNDPAKETYTREQLESDEAVEALARSTWNVNGRLKGEPDWGPNFPRDRSTWMDEARRDLTAALDALDKGKGGEENAD